MLDFPSNPQPGDTYSSGGRTWTWDGAKWTPGGPGGAFLPISGGTLTGPLILAADPAVALGAATKRYTDAGDAARLALAGGVMSGLLTLAQDPVGPLDSATKEYVDNAVAYQFRQNRNRLINGDFRFDQWLANASATPASGAYISDRWCYFGTVASKFTTQNIGPTNTFSAALPSAIMITSAAATVPAAADYFCLQQRIEWGNVCDIGWPRSIGVPLTLSFMCFTTVAGTYSGCLRNGASSRNYVFSYNMPANVWTPISITIPPDTAGTWTAAANAMGMILTFDLGSGANNRAPAGAWYATAYFGANGAISLCATSGAVIYFGDVQLELGNQATPFDFRPYGTEFALCQRYYQTGAGYGGGLFFGGNVTTGGGYWAQRSYYVPMRATPTVVLSGGAGSSFPAASGTLNNNTVWGLQESRVASATATPGWFTSNFTSNAEL